MSIISTRGFKLGQRAQHRRIFTERDLSEFISFAGDLQPGSDELLVDEKRAAVVPGPLLGGMFSYLLGTQLPGRGTNYLKQRLTFPTPAHVGEEITAVVEIVRLRPEKELVNLRTICLDQSGTIVCEGEALVLVTELEIPARQ